MKYAIWGAYCAFLGYKVRQHGLDTKLLGKANDAFDALARRNARIWTEELQTVLVPAELKAGDDASTQS